MLELLLRQQYHLKKIEISSQRPVLDLSVINPDLPPEQEIIDKLTEFTLLPGANRYCAGSGLPELKGSFAKRYEKSFAVNDLSADNVCVANGTQDALLAIFKSLSDPQLTHGVLLPKPFYMQHLIAAKHSRLDAHFYELSESAQTILENIDVALTGNSAIKFVITNFPNNPTGIQVDSDFYNQLSALSIKHDVIVINDFIYGALEHEQNYALSMLSVENPTNFIEIYSLSKAYSVPGWRIAGIVGSEDLIQKVRSHKDQVDYGSFIPQQMAAAHILNSEKDLSKKISSTYKKRKEFVLDILAKDFKVSPVSAGCSLWFEIPKEINIKSFNFCQSFLEETAIALQPAELFGVESAHFRFSLTAELSQLEHASKALVQKLAK